MTERTLFSGGEFLIADVRPEQIFAVEEMTTEHRMIYSAAIDSSRGLELIYGVFWVQIFYIPYV